MRIVLSLALVLASFGLLTAEDKKDTKVELKGEICCAKCELEKADKCHSVLVAKNKEGKEEVFYFDDEASKKYHGECCKGRKEATVTGTVTEKDGKKVVKVEKLDIKKKG